MKFGASFKERLNKKETLVGTFMTSTDPCISEALCPAMDFMLIDAEHNPLSLEVVQSHIITIHGCEKPVIVRVAWNDPVLIKPVLDIGSDGIVVPLIRTADDACRAVEGCLYPPAGVRGFGPRRPSNYGRVGGPDFCKEANESIIIIVQIEHIDAVNNLDEILAVPGITSVLIGSNDLSGSMGLLGQPRHPEVLSAVETIIEKAKGANVPIGFAYGGDTEVLIEVIDQGVSWVTVGADFLLLVNGAETLTGRIRDHIQSTHTSR